MSEQSSTPSRRTPTFIDLFAGIGGIRLGFEAAGFECVFSSEIDSECHNTYAANFGKFPYGDITKTDASAVPKHDVLTAGFPCQPFSISGLQEGFDDTRGTLFFEILRILSAKKPAAVFLENVKHLRYHDGGNTMRVILHHLAALGYVVSWRILDSADFGSAQRRERAFIIGSLEKAFDFDSVEKAPRCTLETVLDQTGPFKYLNPKEYTLIKHPKLQKSGLIFAGYRKQPIRVKGVRPNTEHLSRVHKQQNRIYSAKGLYSTLSSQETSGRFWILHGGRVRKLTMNECYRLMGFPPSFKNVSAEGRQYSQLGNSVYVPLVDKLAREIRRQFF